jgi:anti-sigma factor RsiW
VLALFFDGALSPERHREVAEHLRGCVACREVLARLHQNDRTIAAWGSIRTPIPIATEARVHRSVEKRSRARPLLALGRMMPAALGTSVAAMLVLVTANLAPLYHGGVQSTRPSPQPLAAKMLRVQSAPLRFERGKSAVVNTNTVPPPAFVHHQALLDDIY